MHDANLRFIEIKFYKSLNVLYPVLVTEVSPLKDVLVYNRRISRPFSKVELDRLSMVLTR